MSTERGGKNGVVKHLERAELDAGLASVEESPSDVGTLVMIVSRPEVDERKVLERGELIVGEGLSGDNYMSPDRGTPHPEAQLNLMNSRAIDLVSGGDQERWPLAGDQLFVDFDLSLTNAPTGTRLAIGTAVVEVSAKPHNGCAKFGARFGIDAARWVNSSDEHRLRGINAVVVQAGSIAPGDSITRLD